MYSVSHCDFEQYPDPIAAEMLSCTTTHYIESNIKKNSDASIYQPLQWSYYV